MLTGFGENRGGAGHIVLSFRVQILRRVLNLRMADDSTNILNRYLWIHGRCTG
jgi:hypothetical protein